MVIIDEIRKGAEDKQQGPNLEIDAKRVLLAFYECICLRHVFALPKIEKCKNEYPNQINKMPIKS